MSAPRTAGEISMGVKVLSTTRVMRLAWALWASAGISATFSVGLPTVSVYHTRVSGRVASSNASGPGGIHKRHVDAPVGEQVRQQGMGAAVNRATGHDMVALPAQL